MSGSLIDPPIDVWNKRVGLQNFGSTVSNGVKQYQGTYSDMNSDSDICSSSYVHKQFVGLARAVLIAEALLATSPFVLMRALDTALPLGTQSTFTTPPADKALSNSLQPFIDPESMESCKPSAYAQVWYVLHPVRCRLRLQTFCTATSLQEVLSVCSMVSHDST